jgi:predicted DNA-binding transcriptional regulator AlpA
MSENQLLVKPYLNEKEVAAITGRALSTLRNERFMRKGLPYLKIGGRSIRYRSGDVIAYMESLIITFDEVQS